MARMDATSKPPGRLAVATLFAASFTAMGLGMYYAYGKLVWAGMGLFSVAVMIWPWLRRE
jgi:hypothetical protein